MIIAIELTLTFNSISGIYTIESTGQLIPFIIGVGGLWKTVNDLLAEHLKVELLFYHQLTYCPKLTGFVSEKNTA